MELLRFFHPFHKASESLRKSKGKEAEVGKYLEGLMFMSQITLSYFAALKLLGLFYFFVLRITDLFPIIQSVLCVQQSLFWLWSDECWLKREKSFLTVRWWMFIQAEVLLAFSSKDVLWVHTQPPALPQPFQQCFRGLSEGARPCLCLCWISWASFGPHPPAGLSLSKSQLCPQAHWLRLMLVCTPQTVSVT